MTYQEFVNKTSSTNCHAVKLTDSEGNARLGIYNGLANWADIYGFCNGQDAYGGLFGVENLQTEWDEEEDFAPNWRKDYFSEYGYSLA